MEMGTGKTKVALDNAALLWWTGKIDRMLILGPNGPHRVWLTEFDRHFPADIPRTTVLYRSTWTERQRENGIKALNQGSGLLVLLMNIEALASPRAVELAEQFLLGGTSYMVVDESQRIKTPGATRTREVIRLGGHAVYRRILSGTPTTKGIEDLYSQYRFLHWGIIGERTFTAFKSRYCIMGGYMNRQIVGSRDSDRLLELVAPYTYSVTRKECLTLEPPDTVIVKVDLSPEQARAYSSLSKEFVAELPNEELYAVELGVKRLGKLHQITAGHLRLDDGRIVEFPCPRLDVLVGLVEGTEQKVLVWCSFKVDVERIARALEEAGIGSAKYYGGQNDEANEADLMRWRTDDATRVLILTRDKGGEGLTLNEAPIAINYSFSFKFGPWDQALARNYREGQKQLVTYYNLVAPSTVDVRILRVLANKQDLSRIVKDYKAFREWLEAPVDQEDGP